MKDKATRFLEKFRKFKKDNQLSHTKMGVLFDIGRVMAEKIHNGGYVIKDDVTLKRYMQTLERLEKQPDILKYLDTLPKKKIPSMVMGTAGDQIDYLIAERDVLQRENFSLKKQVNTLLTQIDFLHEQLKEKAAIIDGLKKDNRSHNH